MHPYVSRAWLCSSPFDFSVVQCILDCFVSILGYTHDFFMIEDPNHRSQGQHRHHLPDR
jgi:hypothetical protein